MGIAARHAYRFNYLRSEEWLTLRSEALLRDKGACVVCGKVDVFNDEHHVRYRESWWRTQVGDLVTLCRTHHTAAHLIAKLYPFSHPVLIVHAMQKEWADWQKVLNRLVETQFNGPLCEHLERRAEFFTVIKFLKRKLLTDSEGLQ